MKDKLLTLEGDELSRMLTIILLGDARPPYIDLTPAEAFKWRDWAVEKYGVSAFHDALAIVYWDDFNQDRATKLSFKQWLVGFILPEHYLKAAALLAIKEQSK